MKLAALELDTLELHPELPTTASAQLTGGEGTGEEYQVQPLMGRVTTFAIVKSFTHNCVCISAVKMDARVYGRTTLNAPDLGS